MHSRPHRQNTESSTTSRTSRRSGESYSSQSTAATSIYQEPEDALSIRPPLPHATTANARYCTVTYGEAPKQHSYDDARDSRDTYGSSNTSEEEFYEEPEEYDDKDYEYTSASHASPSHAAPSPGTFEAIPTTPQDFATYFPSQRRLNIQHDPNTDDGNMNLVISTELLEGVHKIHMQLYHLRMHELSTRQFSLRRYCRDSGREVCNSIARTASAPNLQRSVSNALASVKRTNSWGSSKSSKDSKSSKAIPERQDSGYASNSDDESLCEDDGDYFTPAAPAPAPKPTNTTKLEFSNYAHVDVKRRGTRTNKRWEFEYWGSLYAWKRVINRDGAATGKKSHSYHLFKNETGHPVAHIVPEMRTTEEVREEELMGGWVPPCSLWISDTKLLAESSDVADVIVASGLIALVDDCARRLSKRNGQGRPAFKRQISLPMSPVKLDMEFVHPREMVKHMFRRGSKDGEGSRPGTARSGSHHGRSPLRFHSPVEAY